MEHYGVKNRNYGKAYSMQRVFCNNLKKSLKNHIKGEVKCNTINDILIVDIYAPTSIVFRYTLDNITSEIVQGFASETCTQIILKKYKKYVENLFFM